MRAKTFSLLASPAAALLGLFFAVPLTALVVDALSEGGAGFARAVALPTFWPSLVGSVALTFVAATLSAAVGLLVAMYLARLPEHRRTALSFIIALPLTFSGLIVAYGFILSYGRAGFVTQLLGYAGLDTATVGGLLYTAFGLAFASSYYLIPRVVMMLLPVLVNFDRAQLDIAESLGATPNQALRHVLLPQIGGALIGAYCLIAAVVFGAYGTALALVGTQLQILPLQLYSLISESGSDFPAAAALSILITAACSGIMAIGEWTSHRHERYLR